jgi:hypothetical protein
LPQLLQRTHQAGETITVRVPFIAKRFGWQWRLEQPHLALRAANRTLQGDSLERYAGTPFLIFGDAATLGDIRQRTKLANNYVMAVAKAVQRQADVQAVVEPTEPPTVALADIVAQADDTRLADGPVNIEDRPAIDPNAPAIVLPEVGRAEYPPAQDSGQ